MGVCVFQEREDGTNDVKMFILDSDGNTLFYGLPTGVNGFSPFVAVNPISQKVYITDEANGVGYWIKEINIDSVNAGGVNNSWDYESTWGSIWLNTTMVSDGGWIVLTRSDAGDGKMYTVGTDFLENYSYQLCGTDRLIDIKLSADKKYFYILNRTDKKLYKIYVRDVKNFANKASFTAACEWVTDAFDKLPRWINLGSGGDDIIVSGYDTWDTDIGVYRVNDNTGAIRWSSPYGFGKVEPDWSGGAIYIAHGAWPSGNPAGSATYFVKLLASDGTRDFNIPLQASDYVENDDTNPSYVLCTALAHDCNIAFVGSGKAHVGGVIPRMMGVDLDTFTRSWAVDSQATNPLLRCLGDPSGSYCQTLIDTNGREPNWSNISESIYFGTSRNLRDAVLTVKSRTANGTAVHHTVALDDGNLLWGETQNVVEVESRGDIDHVRHGDEEPIQVGFGIKYQNLKANDATTFYEALTGTGRASEWVSNRGEDIRCISLEFRVFDPGDYAEEYVLFRHFFHDNIQVEEGNNWSALLITGRSFETNPEISLKL